MNDNDRFRLLMYHGMGDRERLGRRCCRGYNRYRHYRFLRARHRGSRSSESYGSKGKHCNSGYCRNRYFFDHIFLEFR